MTEEQPAPFNTVVSEGGCTTAWLTSAWTRQEIAEEYEWLNIDPARLGEIWFACRWTTPEELADPDRLYDLFGCDPERAGIDTSVVIWRVPAGSPGAHRYWTTDIPPGDHDG